MCEHGTVTLVPTPAFMWDSRSHPENGIAIDSCMADAVVTAWAAGVRTLGSCCGHGKRRPSVVLDYGSDQVALAREALPADWTIEQWHLVDVTHTRDRPMIWPCLGDRRCMAVEHRDDCIRSLETDVYPQDGVTTPRQARSGE
jgi:hypothetical protein